MCGRYAMSMDPMTLQQALNQQYNIPEPHTSQGQPDDPSYNVAPTNNAPTLRMAHDSTDNDSNKDTPTLEWMSWGVIPFWAKERSTSDQYKTFNARLESILDGSKMWKSLRGYKTRCVVPMQGYYEWLHKSTGQGKTKVDKIPYFIKRRDDKLMFMAGLSSHVKFEGEEKSLGTFTIVTGPAPQDMKWLHNRMPIVLEPGTEAWDRWLGGEPWSDELGKESLKEYYEAKRNLVCYEVSRDVGKVQNDGEYLTKELKKGAIMSFFGKREPKSEIKEEDSKSSVVEVKDNGTKKEEKSDIKKEKTASPKKRSIDSMLSIKREQSDSIAKRVHHESKKPKSG